MKEIKKIPTERLSIISALIILNYALMPFIISPQISINYSLFGFVIDFQIEYANLMVITAALFAAVGTYWLIFDHPLIKKSDLFMHLILPTFTAGVMSIPLNEIQIGIAWWIVFTLESLIIIFTFIAEFYSIDQENSLYALSLIIIQPLAISLFLIIAITTRSAGYRLYIQALILIVTFSAICRRMLALLERENKNALTALSAFIFAHVIIACHYLPMNAITYGSTITGTVVFLILLPFLQDQNNKGKFQYREAFFSTLPFLLLAALFFFI